MSEPRIADRHTVSCPVCGHEVRGVVALENIPALAGLSPQQIRLFWLFAAKPGSVFCWEDIFRLLYPETPSYDGQNAVKAVVAQTNAKLKPFSMKIAGDSTRPGRRLTYIDPHK